MRRDRRSLENLRTHVELMGSTRTFVGGAFGIPSRVFTLIPGL